MTQQKILDSQEQLAQSWARGLSKDHPQVGEETELAQLLEEAVRHESTAFELTIAYLRAVFMGLLVLFSLFALLWPRVVQFEKYPVALVAVATVSFVAASFLALALRSGWYHPRIRKVAPLADALVIIAVFGLLHYNLREVWQRAPVGMVALTALACGFLSFSGALRLSRTSGWIATTFACFAWLVMAYIVRMPIVETILVAITVVALGVMGSRITGLIRRGLSNQIIILRYGAMYNDARQAVAAREDILKIVSHDLRNPLNTIAMTTDLIRELPDTDRNYYLDMIARAGSRMNRMIQDLLDVARLDRAHGRLSVTAVATPLPAIVDEALEMMSPLALERGIALDSELPIGLPLVHADSERIVQLFSNLIGNALKFTPRDGAVRIRAQLLDNKVRVTVEDSGPGIPPADIDNIFASFWQANKADRRGIGLGLTIARAIVEGHGEKIGVENKPEGGARFWFTLRVAEGSATRA